MKVITDIEQGTAEWHALRRERVTSTDLDDVMGTDQSQTALIAEKIAQFATEQSKITRPTAEMERGSAEEAFAIKEFQLQYQLKITKATICISDEMPWLAWSPDGLIKFGGKFSMAVEVKSPDSKTSFLYRIYNLIKDVKIPKSKQPFLGVPSDYKWQCVNAFIVNQDLQKLYFIVYDSRIIDPEHRLYVVELTRDMPELKLAIEEATATLIDFRKKWMEWKEIVLPTKF